MPSSQEEPPRGQAPLELGEREWEGPERRVLSWGGDVCLPPEGTCFLKKEEEGLREKEASHYSCKKRSQGCQNPQLSSELPLSEEASPASPPTRKAVTRSGESAKATRKGRGL